MIDPIIRPEIESDISATHAVHTIAFDKPGVADLVDVLRSDGALAVSLVAEKAGAVVGHVATSPASINGSYDSLWYQLSPLGVLPENQKQGIGAALVLQVLRETAAIGGQGIILLGSPKYYSRFGFKPAADIGLALEKHAGPFFQAVQLSGAHVPQGLVKLHPAFDDV